MTYPEWFLASVRTAATKYPDDINKATDRAVKSIRQHEEFDSLIDDMVRDCIRGKVHEFRHQQNIATWKEHGKYGGPAKVNVGASLAVQEVITSVYAYAIAGKTLGSIFGGDLLDIAAGERAKADGHSANAKLCELLAPLVPKDKTVAEAVKETKLRELFRKASLTLRGAA